MVKSNSNPPENTENGSVRRSSRISSASKESKEDKVDAYKKKLCEICKKGENANKMLLCDSCDDGYHSYCLTPKLSRIPSGEWFCTSCSEPNEPTKKEHKDKPQGDKEVNDKPTTHTRSRGSKNRSSDETTSVKGEAESPTGIRRSTWRKSSLDSELEKSPSSVDGSGKNKTGEDETQETARQPRRSNRKRNPSAKSSESVDDSEEDRNGDAEKETEAVNEGSTPISEDDNERDGGGEASDETPPRRSKRAKQQKNRKGGNTSGKRKLDDPEPEQNSDSEDGGSDVICSTCGKGDDEAKLLLCDRRNCNRGTHPIAKVPTGKWFCDTHSSKGPSTREKRRKKELDKDGEEEYEEGSASDEEFSDNNAEAESEDEEGEAPEVGDEGPNSITEDDYRPAPRKHRKHRNSSPQDAVPAEPKQATNQATNHATNQSTTLFSNLEVLKSDTSSIASDFTRIAQSKQPPVTVASPAASPAPSPPATPLPDKPASISWDSTALAPSAAPSASPSAVAEKPIAVAWELSSLVPDKQNTANTPSTTLPQSTIPKPSLNDKSVVQSKPSQKNSVINFWRGGLTVDGKFICNLNAYCKAEWQRGLVRHEWPKVLEVTTCSRPSHLVASHLNTNEGVYLSLLPEKYDQAFHSLVSNPRLEKPKKL